MELARRHCLAMKFVQCGGRGMAEAATGLPINARQIQCPVAIGAESSNLSLIVGGFYRAHCTGCDQRRPTGEVPNLAIAVTQQDTESARQNARHQAKIARAHERWSDRSERRRALTVSSGEAMADALTNIELFDQAPGSEADPETRERALTRLTALADRASHVFTPEVANLAIDLAIDVDGSPELLEPLRRLAHTRLEFVVTTLQAALVVLRRSPVVAAGRCVSDFASHVSPHDLDEEACRSLILLAGAPHHDEWGHSQPNQAADPTGLRVAAEVVPDNVLAVLRRMLPPPAPRTSLILATPEPPRAPATAFERASAAGALLSLTSTHLSIVTPLVSALILSLATEPNDDYDDPATPAIVRVLAAMLIIEVGDIKDAVEEAGRTGSNEYRETLFRVFTRATDMLHPDGRRREPGDPIPDESRRTDLLDAVFSVGIARLGGDWGDDVRCQAAELLEELADMDPSWFLHRFQAAFGALLHLVDEMHAPSPSRLEVVSVQSPFLCGLEQHGHEVAINSAARRLLDAVKKAAAVDPLRAVALARVCPDNGVTG